MQVATPRARIVRLDLNGRTFDYEAGQAVLVAKHGHTTRKPYSIASAPEDARRDRSLELLVGVEADGSAGDHLPLDSGAAIDVEGPGTSAEPGRPPPALVADRVGRAGPTLPSPHAAGWSSLVARRAHNPKVVGSNPTLPPTKQQVRPHFSEWGLAAFWGLTSTLLLLRGGWWPATRPEPHARPAADQLELVRHTDEAADLRAENPKITRAVASRSSGRSAPLRTGSTSSSSSRGLSCGSTACPAGGRGTQCHVWPRVRA